MTADYSTARGKLRGITDWLNEDDCDTVELRYADSALPVATGPDFAPLLGTLTDGELYVLATHSCSEWRGLAKDLQGQLNMAAQVYAYAARADLEARVVIPSKVSSDALWRLQVAADKFARHLG